MKRRTARTVSAPEDSFNISNFRTTFQALMGAKRNQIVGAFATGTKKTFS
jgi:hypothetical protein